MLLQIPSVFEVVNGIVVLEGRMFTCTVPEEMLVLDTPAWVRGYRNLFAQDARSSARRGDGQRAEQSALVVAEIDTWLRDASASVTLFTPLARRKTLHPLIVDAEALPSFLNALLREAREQEWKARSGRAAFLIEYAEDGATFYAVKSLAHILAHPGPAVLSRCVTQAELEAKFIQNQ